MGKLLIVIGILIVVIGLLLHYTSFNLNWFGRLPGDIRIENENFKMYIPITSMLLISIVISVILWISKRI